MEQREKDKSFVDIGYLQEEADEAIGDYAPAEIPHPEAAKKPTQLSIQPTPESKKKIIGRTLEEQLRDVWLEEKTLKDIGLKRCDGFFRNNSYHFFKDSKSTIYLFLFEKHQEKEKYKLTFMVSPYGKG